VRRWRALARAAAEPAGRQGGRVPQPLQVGPRAEGVQGTPRQRERLRATTQSLSAPLCTADRSVAEELGGDAVPDQPRTVDAGGYVRGDAHLRLQLQPQAGTEVFARAGSCARCAAAECPLQVLQFDSAAPRHGRHRATQEAARTSLPRCAQQRSASPRACSTRSTAVQKAMYKPAAFFKGILLPIAEVRALASLRSAVWVGTRKRHAPRRTVAASARPSLWRASSARRPFRFARPAHPCCSSAEPPRAGGRACPCRPCTPVWRC
jgi:hypothetical protein